MELIQVTLQTIEKPEEPTLKEQFLKLSKEKRESSVARKKYKENNFEERQTNNYSSYFSNSDYERSRLRWNARNIHLVRNFLRGKSYKEVEENTKTEIGYYETSVIVNLLQDYIHESRKNIEYQFKEWLNG